MKIRIYIIMLGAILLLAGPVSAGEIMEDLDISGTVDFSSHYMFRGAAIVDVRRRHHEVRADQRADGERAGDHNYERSLVLFLHVVAVLS